MISARAFGVLCYLASNPDKISAEELARVFKESRKPFLAALRELRAAGFIETRKERIGSNWVTVSKLREYPLGSSETALLIPMALQNSNNAVILHSLKTITNPPTESAEEKMPYEFFEKTSSMDHDEVIAARDKKRAADKAKYEESRAATAKAKFKDRHDVQKSSWTCTDVAFEFADRVQEHWHIKPWQVTKSLFFQALGTARKQHDTNGEMEVEAMTRFFDSISINQYDDAEILWKMFIKRFPMFIGQIRNVAMPDDEISDEALIQSEKTMERFRRNVQG